MARCEGLNLNFRAYGSAAEVQCCMCNIKEVDDTLHFVGACPILSPIRERFYNKKKLTKTEIIIIILYGENSEKLFKYLKEAIVYRKI